MPGHASPVITQPCSVTPCVNPEVCKINIDPAIEMHLQDFQAGRALSECSLKPSGEPKAGLQYTSLPARCIASRHTNRLQTSEIEPCGCRQRGYLYWKARATVACMHQSPRWNAEAHHVSWV